MKTTQISIRSKANNRNMFFKRKVKESKTAEILAWCLFFGVGVVYFIATLVLALD